DNDRIFHVSGQIFFVSKEEFLEAFDFDELVDRVTINLTHAHLWDQGAVGTVEQIMTKFRRNGIDVELVGLNEASATLWQNLTKEPELKLINSSVEN
ncbi:SulP family inorganic anion transporter, partial [Synechocystis sp. LEGE 06083]|uniref:STAS domain-containing protein n=1 Tax=Synechocystis sp. LEGE 06083 TaxID=915336 RepID=UPI001882A936